MELLPTTVITDSEIVLEQRWVEAENKFEIKMQMRERGEVKFQTSIKHENFLGASDESINLCLGHLRFTELVNLTRTIMNNCREPLTFSLAKDRLKITDSEGEYYYSYSFYYKDICYFIKEPTFLHEVFWEFLNSILNDEFNFNAFDFMKRYFESCREIIKEITTALKYSDGCRRPSKPSTNPEDYDIDWTHFLLLTSQINKCREIFKITFKTESEMDDEVPTPRGDRNKNYFEACWKFLDVFVELEELLKVKDYRAVIELLVILEFDSSNDINRIFRYFDPSRTDYSRLEIDLPKTLQLLTVEKVIDDFKQVMASNMENKNQPETVKLSRFWRRLYSHHLVPLVKSVVLRILLESGPRRLCPNFRIYPVTEGDHLDNCEEDKRIEHLTKNVKIQNRNFDIKLDGSKPQIRLAASNQRPAGEWQQWGAPTYDSMQPYHYLCQAGQFIVVLHGEYKVQYSQMSVFPTEDVDASNFNFSQAKWQIYEYNGFTFKNILGCMFDKYLVTKIETPGFKTSIMFLQIDQVEQKAPSQKISIESLIEDKVDDNIESGDHDKKDMIKHNDNWIFMCGDLILITKMRDVAKNAKSLVTDIFLHRIVLKVKDITRKGNEGSRVHEIEHEKLADYSMSYTMSKVINSPFNEEANNYGNLFQLSSKVWIFTYFSLVSNNINLFAITINKSAKILPLHKQSAFLTKTLMNDRMEDRFELIPKYYHRRKLLTYTKIDHFPNKSNEIYLFKLK